MSSYLSHRRALPAALAACLALGLGSATVSAAAPADAATAHASQARRGARARRQATRTAKGGAFLNGRAVPGRRVGSVGDFYLRTSNRTLYGPKTGRGWGRPVSLVGPTGAQGPQGNPGATGTPGPAGTPAFGTGVVTTIAAPAALTGTYGDDGFLDADFVDVGTVTVPAGVSLAQLRVRATPGDGFTAANGGVACEVTNAASYAVAAYGLPGQLAVDAIGWTTFAQPTTFAVRCALSAASGGTPGATLSASVAGTQVVVFAANVAGT